jgi:3-oxoacyl-[acyl-carrier protein] reductase
MILDKKIAIVTGSAQGIGFGIALKLATEGATVILTDMNEAKCLEASRDLNSRGFVTEGVLCDITDKNSIQKVVEMVKSKYGKLDILVNNAGIFPFVTFDQMTEEDWDKVMIVNLKGMFMMTKLFSKLMNEGSKIVNISSIASMIGFEGLVHYCTSKSGVNGFTRTLALEMAPKKINVNAVAPGAIDTPGTKMTEESKSSYSKNIPMNRVGKPEDIANAVFFLSSNLSDYITGQVIVVDGGWTLK